MKLFLTLFTCLLFLSSCNSSKVGNKNTSLENEKKMNSDYHVMTEKEKLSDFVGKKVSFEGNISLQINQHMMKSSPFDDGTQGEKYFDPLETYSFGQIVVYYNSNEVEWPVDKKRLKVYGVVDKMSGAGKGGGTHTEYYLDADKVE